MKLEEAIEALELSFTDPWISPKGRFGDAVKLGIEALKWVKEKRQDAWTRPIKYLPGETEE